MAQNIVLRHAEQMLGFLQPRHGTVAAEHLEHFEHARTHGLPGHGRRDGQQCGAGLGRDFSTPA